MGTSTRHKINLGTHAGGVATVDLDVILRTNLLVQANSGGGKSWLLRRLAEQVFGHVPVIIIDVEGEFSTLREKFDFVLVGKEGDTPASVRYAKELAHRLLKLGASAIIDLFEMPKHERPQYVASFVQALVDAPKDLWRDLLVLVDEAHELAPELGRGAQEGRDIKLCRQSLTDLAAKGRKRGYGVAAFTQRLGKLNKDFAGELKNALVGQTWMDIDRERAALQLGVAKADKFDFFNQVKNLEPGTFYALGRALHALEPTIVTIGGVQSEHPEPGRRKRLKAPPPTDKIRHLLPQLSDLPAEAEQKIQTEKDLRAEITELKRELAKKPVALVSQPITIKTTPVLKDGEITRLEKLVDKLSHVEEKFVRAVADGTNTLAQRQQVVVSEIGNITAALRSVRTPHPQPRAPVPTPSVPPPPRSAPARPSPAAREGTTTNSTTDLPRYALELLQVVARRDFASDTQISALSGYRRTSSAFPKMLARLTRDGFIVGDSKHREITAAGRVVAGDVEPQPTGAALLEHWVDRLTTQEGAFLRAIHSSGTISREDLTTAAAQYSNGAVEQYSPTSSSFGKTISALCKLGLISKTPDGNLAISESFT